MKLGVVLSAIVAIVGSFIGSGAWVGTPIAEAAGGALSATSTLVAPAGPAFSIWSVVYLGFFAYAIWQFLPGRGARHEVLRIPIAVSMILNAAWILSIQANLLWLSVVVIAALLAVLARVFVLLRQRPPESTVDAVITDGTMGLYLGWVCVATIANVTAWLVDLGITSGATVFAVLVLIAALFVGVMLASYSRGAIAPSIGIALGAGLDSARQAHWGTGQHRRGMDGSGCSGSGRGVDAGHQDPVVGSLTLASVQRDAAGRQGLGSEPEIAFSTETAEAASIAEVATAEITTPEVATPEVSVTAEVSTPEVSTPEITITDFASTPGAPTARRIRPGRGHHVDGS